MIERRPLTDDELQQARALYRDGMRIAAIARQLGQPDMRVRRALDPVYAEKAGQFRSKAREVAGIGQPDPHELKNARRLQRQIPPDTRGLTAYLCGDPLPGRSALDRSAS